MIMDDHRWFSLNHSLVKLPQNHFSNRLTVQLAGTTSKLGGMFSRKKMPKRGWLSPHE